MTVDSRIRELEGRGPLRYGVHLYRNATTAAISTVTITLITWTTAIYDPFGFWTVGTPTLMTVPIGGAGLYLAKFYTQWDQGSSVTAPLLGVHVVNSAADNFHHDQGLYTNTAGTGPTRSDLFFLDLNEGDQVKPWVYHESGANRVIQTTVDADIQRSPYFKMFRLNR